MAFTMMSICFLLAAARMPVVTRCARAARDTEVSLMAVDFDWWQKFLRSGLGLSMTLQPLFEDSLHRYHRSQYSY